MNRMEQKTEIAGYVEDSRTSSWHVTLRAGIHTDE